MFAARRPVVDLTRAEQRHAAATERMKLAMSKLAPYAELAEVLKGHDDGAEESKEAGRAARKATKH